MGKVTFSGLWARKRRLVGTFLAVFIGVAFLSGTLVLGDTLSDNFDALFSSITKGTSAVARGTTKLSASRSLPVRGAIDASLVSRVRAVPGVAAAQPTVRGYGALIGRDGKAIGGNGPPQLAGNWIEDAPLNPYRLAEGRAPSAADEVVVNRGAAKQAKLHVGDTATVRTPEPVTVRVVGIATFGNADGFGSATFTAFTLPAAQQRVLGSQNRVSSVLVRGAAGRSEADVARAIAPVLPAGVESVTGSQLAKESIDDVHRTFLDMLRTFLVVFAGIALLVATFSIYNTFSIIAAQRTRDSALLRAIGATRRQILVAAVVEAVVIGAVASLIGLLGGVGVAGLLKGMFDAFGFALPAGGLAFKAHTAVTALIVGTLVTLVAAISPAVRSSRIPPLAALRDVAAERTDISVVRAIAGVALAGGGVAIILAAVIGGVGSVLPLAGLGALLTIVGVVVFGPVVARPAASVLGAPVAGLRGVTGALARGNAMRNPKRTSGTAAALMVGVAVVTMFTLFASSMKASLRDSLMNSFGGDLVISSGSFGRPALSPRLATDVDKLPQVRTAVGLGGDVVRLGTSDRDVTIADTARVADVFDLHVARGSLSRLRNGDIAISKKMADNKDWRVGTTVPVTFLDGTTAPLRIGAVYKNGDVAGDVLVDRALWAPHAVQSLDARVLIKLRPGVGLGAGRAAVEHVAAAYGGPTVRDRAEFVASESERIDMLLGLVYVLLALAVLIALMGIANTLSLSIHERTRELGLLRAIGQTRAQLRSMVRWESVMISSFGAVGGLGVGVFLGWAMTRAASSGAGITTFAAPVGTLAVVVVMGALAGVLAGLRPARRAARLGVLSAIGAE